MSRLYFALLILIIINHFSCRRDEFGEINVESPAPIFEPNGIWCINEGLLGQGNGDLSFLNLNKRTISNNVFFNIHGFRPGDILCDIFVDDSLIILTVNNSNRIWILRKKDFSIKNVINNIKYPRFIAKFNEGRFLVTAFAHDSMHLIKYQNNQWHLQQIYSENPTENIIIVNDKIFVSHWSNYGGIYSNNSISVYDLHSLNKITSISVGKEPNSMSLDKNNNLWVLCSGGYDNTENPSLWQISPESLQVIKKLVFPYLYSSPFSLTIDPKGQWLYYINKHIYKMHINDNNLPTQPIIISNEQNFYNVNASIENGYLLVADAQNFVTAGFVLVYDDNGNLLQSFQAGIVPSCFRKHK